MDRLVALCVIAGISLQGCGGSGGGAAPAPPPPPNRAPVSVDQSVGTDPGEVVSSTLSASDADGDLLTYAVVDNPTFGAVVLSDTGNRTFEYTPNPGFSGTDTFTFNASDGEATSNSATVTVNVNFDPVAAGASVATSDAASVSGTVSATDTEGDVITFAIVTQPTKGSVTLFNTSTGDFTYMPDVGEDGLDSFAVTASDAFRASAPVNVDVEIFGWPAAQQFGTAGEDFPTTSGFFAEMDTSIFIGGGTDGQLGATANAGMADSWVRRLDRRGGEQWTVQTGTADDDGARVITPAVDGSGIYNLITDNQGGARIMKHDVDGNEILDAVVDFGIGVTIAAVYWGDIDPDNNFWVLSWDTDGNSLITKVSGVTGNTLWQRDLVASDNNPVLPFLPESQAIRVRSVDFDSAGNAIVAGWVTDSGTFSRNCTQCGWLASYDTDGNRLWLLEIPNFSVACGAQEEGRIYRARLAADDTIWISGTGGTFSESTPNYSQVSKYSADGTQLLWSECTTPEFEGVSAFTPVRFASNGDGLLLTSTGGVFDANTGRVRPFGINLKRLDNDGNIVFSRDLSATRADSSAAIMSAGDIFIDGQGLIYVSGSTDGELTNAASAGAEDIFLLRFDADGNPL